VRLRSRPGCARYRIHRLAFHQHPLAFSDRLRGHSCDGHKEGCKGFRNSWLGFRCAEGCDWDSCLSCAGTLEAKRPNSERNEALETTNQAPQATIGTECFGKPTKRPRESPGRDDAASDEVVRNQKKATPSSSKKPSSQQVLAKAIGTRNSAEQVLAEADLRLTEVAHAVGVAEVTGQCEAAAAAAAAARRMTVNEEKKAAVDGPAAAAEEAESV
jgi:hypothetical protein